MPAAIKISLSRQERSTLQSWVAWAKPNQHLYKRAQIVLEAAKGKTNTEIASEVGVNKDTVGTIRNRFAENGIGAIATNRPYRRAKPSLRKKLTPNILHKTIHETPHEGPRWTQESLAREIGTSPSMIARVWRAHGVGYSRVVQWNRKVKRVAVGGKNTRDYTANSRHRRKLDVILPNLDTINLHASRAGYGLLSRSALASLDARSPSRTPKASARREWQGNSIAFPFDKPAHAPVVSRRGRAALNNQEDLWKKGNEMAGAIDRSVAHGQGNGHRRGLFNQERAGLPGERRQGQAAFTLVELLVVISIISILAGFLLPALGKAIEAGRSVQCQNNQKQIGLGILGYTQEFSRFPPGYDDSRPTRAIFLEFAGAYILDEVSLPMTAEQWRSRASTHRNHGGRETIFGCPSDNGQDGNYPASLPLGRREKSMGSYDVHAWAGLNAFGEPSEEHDYCLNVKPSASIRFPTECFLLVDGVDGAGFPRLQPSSSLSVEMRHLAGDNYNILYCDGHVKSENFIEKIGDITARHLPKVLEYPKLWCIDGQID